MASMQTTKPLISLDTERMILHDLETAQYSYTNQLSCTLIKAHFPLVLQLIIMVCGTMRQAMTRLNTSNMMFYFPTF